MKVFRTVLLMLCAVCLMGSLTGCQTFKEGIAKKIVKKQEKKTDRQHEAWLASLSERDFSSDLEEKCSITVGTVSSDIETMLMNIMLSESPERSTLVGVFREIHAQEHESAKLKFMAFISSPTLMTVVTDQLQLHKGRYANYTPEQMEIIKGAAYQHYEKKIMHERDEYYAQGRIDLVLNFTAGD